MPFANTADNIREVEGIAGASLLEPAACSWDDVALSRRAEKTFREISRRVNAGKRVAALFSGPAGSGKTRAASLIAHELDRGLIHVSLSALDGCPVPETEKILQKLFAVADPESIVLLFDEADALFAKRSEAERGGDDYAGLEERFLAYVEAYRGLAIVATHHCKRIDPLLVHRLHFAVKI